MLVTYALTLILFSGRLPSLVAQARRRATQTIHRARSLAAPHSKPRESAGARAAQAGAAVEAEVVMVEAVAVGMATEATIIWSPDRAGRRSRRC